MQGRFLSRNHLVGEFVLSEELHHPNILRICRLFSVNPFAAPKTRCILKSNALLAR
jgi:hypothetical protein